jgi:hypothetical protein
LAELVVVAGFAGAVVSVFASVGTVASFVVSGTAAGTAGSVRVVPPVFKTDTSPVTAGIDSSKAAIIKQIAALIVILDKTDCVPRGPNAVLEILLVKSAPASALPGCSKTVTTSTRQETKNKPYKI